MCDMKTRFEKIDSNNINKDIINEAGDIIKSGGLVAFPTETVYGLGGDALNAKSSEKIYAVRHTNWRMHSGRDR